MLSPSCVRGWSENVPVETSYRPLSPGAIHALAPGPARGPICSPSGGSTSLSRPSATTRQRRRGWATAPASEPIRVRHLLQFASGIGGYAESDDPLDRAWRSPDIEAADLGALAARVERVARLPLYEEPGTRWR